MRTREADVRDAVLLGEGHDDRANARPEVDVLMGVEVAELQAEVEPGLHLGAQLAADVVEVDPTGCRAGHEGSVGQRESSGAVHEPVASGLPPSWSKRSMVAAFAQRVMEPSCPAFAAMLTLTFTTASSSMHGVMPATV